MDASASSSDRRRIHMLGQAIDVLDMEALNEIVGQAIEADHRIIIGNHNLHSLSLAQHDAAMQRFFERADVVHIDGMPVVTLARLFGESVEVRHRVTYIDWIDPLMSLAAANGWRVFHLGGEPGIGETAAEILESRHPGLELATRHGYFDVTRGSTENDEVLATLRAFGPQILLVGMGMPRQETWVLDNSADLGANVILMTGACFDYIAGAVPTPPRWAGRVGLEWLFRLAAEPGRLGRRYLIEPWGLLPPVVAELRARRAARRTGGA